MKNLMFILILPLAACATGDKEKDCLAATNMVSAAQLASLAAATNAANNPQSPRMQALADLAAGALTIAQANQASACPTKE